jgi:hypothetical protein
VRFLFHGIVAGGWFSLVLAEALAGPQQSPSVVATGPRVDALRPVTFDTFAPPSIYSSPELDKENAGLPGNSRPEILTWERVFTLALIHHRAADGRTVETLIPSELATKAKQHGIDDFARFRTDFLAAQPDGRGTFRDPTTKYLKLLGQMQSIHSTRRNSAFQESLLSLMRELIQGESGGLSQLDVDRVSASLERAHQQLAGDIRTFRNELDQIKVGIGLSPHAAVVPDRQILANFGFAFEFVDKWFRGPDRSLADLHSRVNRVPDLGKIGVGGRQLLGANLNTLDESLTDAARIAIKSRGVPNEGLAEKDAQTQLELRVRRQLRDLLDIQSAYDGVKHSYELAARLKDQTFERMATTTHGVPGARSALLDALLDHTEEMRDSEIRLVGMWVDFRAQRLALYREIGALPYNDWKAFYVELLAGQAVPFETPARANRPAAELGPPPAPPVPDVSQQPSTSPPR